MTKKPMQNVTELRTSQGNGHDKWASRMSTTSRGQLSWSDVNPEHLAAALAAVTEDGAALLLSRTSDGGALAIHVLANGHTHKLYPATKDELTEALGLITAIAIS